METKLVDIDNLPNDVKEVISLDHVDEKAEIDIKHTYRWLEFNHKYSIYIPFFITSERYYKITATNFYYPVLLIK